MASDDGLQAIETIKSYLKGSSFTFPVSLFVARGPGGTACSEEGVDQMKKILKDKLEVLKFNDAGHSIHNTSWEEICDTVNKQWKKL